MGARQQEFAQGFSEELNKVLRGEISAMMAYEQVMDRFQKKEPERLRLQKFHQDHAEVIQRLQRDITVMGGTPVEESGAWGAIVKSLLRLSQVFGSKAILQTLKIGEAHGLVQYRDLLESNRLTKYEKAYIKEKLIPQQELHIISLEAMKRVQ